jgi:hypothetical protein
MLQRAQEVTQAAKTHGQRCGSSDKQDGDSFPQGTHSQDRARPDANRFPHRKAEINRTCGRQSQTRTRQKVRHMQAVAQPGPTEISSRALPKAAKSGKGQRQSKAPPLGTSQCYIHRRQTRVRIRDRGQQQSEGGSYARPESTGGSYDRSKEKALPKGEAT